LNKGARNFTIRFESGQCPECVGAEEGPGKGYKTNCTCHKGTLNACDRVIEYRTLKEEPENILNMINVMKWINANNPNCEACKGSKENSYCNKDRHYTSGVCNQKKINKDKSNGVEGVKACRWVTKQCKTCKGSGKLFTNKCKYNDLLDELEHKDTLVEIPYGYKKRGEKRRLASCSWTSAVFRYAMDSIENMEALDQRPRASRRNFE